MSDILGPFRLMQKIEEDVLGEVFCAARMGEDGREEVALLRLFDRAGVDPECFVERIAAREPLAASRGLGVVDGRAFDFFSYLPGISLATLIERARQQRQPFPLGVALFVASRVADGLADAYRQEIEGESALHGFVVPYLVTVSEEGSVQLGGLAAAAALRDFRGTAAAFARILPYLSPGSVSGGDLHPCDDVYSLGAILYEMLTLQRLASPSDLRLEADDIPSDLLYLLDRSVAPRFRRIQSAVEWLRELRALAASEGWVASARDLSAFYAQVDERVRPLEPDTTRITARDREILAQAIREARNRQEAGTPDADDIAAAAEADDERGDRPADSTSYDTNVISRDVLPSAETGGRLVKTSHVKRAAAAFPVPPV